MRARNTMLVLAGLVSCVGIKGDGDSGGLGSSSPSPSGDADADSDSDTDTDADGDTDTDTDTDTDADTDTGTIGTGDGEMNFDVLLTSSTSGWWNGERIDVNWTDPETGEEVSWGQTFTLLFIDRDDYYATAGTDDLYYCKLTYDISTSTAIDESLFAPWPGWTGTGSDFLTWELGTPGFMDIEGNCLDITRAMGWTDINDVSYLNWGNAYSSMNDSDFEDTLIEAYDDYDEFRDAAGIEYVLVSTDAGDQFLPLNLLFIYDIDEAGNLLDTEPTAGIHDATEAPNGLYLSRSVYGLVFSTAETTPDTGR